jgi:teichuronic acid biosynthesis glycosyltransferase TuaH
MLKGRDIVVIGLQPWYYEIGSNCKNIATHLAMHNRVVYVNLPINRKTFLSRDPNPGIQQHIQIIKQKGEQLKQIRENLWEFYPTCIVESINWLPSTKAFKALNYVNNRRFAKEILQAMEQLDFHDIILFNDNDIFNGFYLKQLLSPALYVYYCRDYLRGNPYWGKHCDELEPELIKNADLAVANSAYLADYCARHNKNSYDIGQGCNLELFDDTRNFPVPEEMQWLNAPIIGYVGAVIANRLDEEIIRIIAKSNPSWNVVLVGPEDDTFRNSSLHQMANVVFIGRKPIEQLPHFIRCFDVCINPQLVNMLTIGNYPLKVDEYLAMGKPVVATRTKTMELFEEYTYLADKPEDYPSLIEKALKEDGKELQKKRSAFARTHTWENSVGELYKRIEQKENLN